MVALRFLWKITEGEKCSDFWRVDHIVQASPNVHQAWAGTQNTDHCRDGWAHLVQVEETRHRLRHDVYDFERIRGSGTGIPKSRRIKIQDLVEHHSLILCGAHGFARESSAMESAQQCLF